MFEFALFSPGHSNFPELEYLFLIEHLMEYEDFLLRPFLLAHQTSNELFDRVELVYQ